MQHKKSFSLRYFLVYLLVLGVFLSSAFVISESVTVISGALPVKRSCIIVIDPGHGGEDGGATSCSGILESNINLEIALRLNDLFHLLGYPTKMIRTSDRSVYTQGNTIASKKVSDLKNRVKTTNETENALLLSIHQNQFSESRYSGAQVFYSSNGESKLLAETLQSALVSTVNPGSNRKSKKASKIYLMEHIRCPGILVECGFLSNPEEEAKLRKPEYQKKLSCVIAATVGSFLSKSEAS